MIGEMTREQAEAAFTLLRTPGAWDDEKETAFNELIDAGLLEECGCCEHYHPAESQYITPPYAWNDFYGDCRDDNNRFPYSTLRDRS